MGKSIYIPTMDEFYTIQDMNINVYNYLLAKVIEVLTLEGIVYYNKGILKNEFKYFRENEELVRAICSMYPEELWYTEVGKYNTNLCLDLINKKEDNSIYNLDNLQSFNENTLNNIQVIKSVINILSTKLLYNPKYRFEYKTNKLLNDIFSTEFINNIFYETSMMAQLSRIEPAYIIKDKNIDNKLKPEILNSAMNFYLERYKLSQSKGKCLEYNGKDILTNPDQDTKRLIRCIEKRKNNKY